MSSLQYSSASMLTMPPFEDLFDDILSPLRIPPLKSVFPSTTTDRPPPLEPATQINVDNEASKITGRQMALAQAKIIEAPMPNEFEAIAAPSIDDAEPRRISPLEEHNKKKRKLAHHEQLADFVHLPKPKPKLEDVNRRPFRPIAVLNQLNEPPPSAALFPPITPNQEEHERSGSTERVDNETGTSPYKGATGTRECPGKDSTPVQPKRNYTRPRRKWTEAETECLKKGVAICGVGRWKDILEHPNLHFQEGRTYVDLKDRFRTLYPPNQPEKWVGKSADKGEGSEDALEAARPSSQRQRAPYRGWSEREDAELDKGFKVYGYQWHLIAQDESLHFNNRSANQVRDRFRRRFPELYKEQPPVLIAEKAKKKTEARCRMKAPRKRSSRKTSDSPRKKEGQAPISATKMNNGNSGNLDAERDKGAPKGTAPNFLSGLLNGEEEDTEFSRSLAALDDLTLPPLQWDDMAVQPIFDLG
ncbi:MAG: hypothetical protein Q9217_003899 [Psora testacea]